MSQMERLSCWRLLAACCIGLAALQLAAADYTYQFGPVRLRQSQARPMGNYQPLGQPLFYPGPPHSGPFYRLAPHRRFLPPSLPAPFMQPFPSYEPLGPSYPSYPNSGISSSVSASSSSSSSSSSLASSSPSSSPSPSNAAAPVRPSIVSPSSSSEAQPSSVNRAPSTQLRPVMRQPSGRRPQNVSRVRVATSSPAPPVVSSTTLQPTPTPSGAVGPAVVNDADIGFDIPLASNSDSSSLAGPVLSSPVSRPERPSGTNVGPASVSSSSDGFTS